MIPLHSIYLQNQFWIDGENKTDKDSACDVPKLAWAPRAVVDTELSRPSGAATGQQRVVVVSSHWW